MKKMHPAIAELSQNIKKTRRMQTLTQEYMAFKLGISQNAYSKIENGMVPLTVDRLLDILEIFDIDITAVLPTRHIYTPPVDDRKSIDLYKK